MKALFGSLSVLALLALPIAASAQAGGYDGRDGWSQRSVDQRSTGQRMDDRGALDRYDAAPGARPGSENRQVYSNRQVPDRVYENRRYADNDVAGAQRFQRLDNHRFRDDHGRVYAWENGGRGWGYYSPDGYFTPYAYGDDYSYDTGVTYDGADVYDAGGYDNGAYDTGAYDNGGYGAGYADQAYDNGGYDNQSTDSRSYDNGGWGAGYAADNGYRSSSYSWRYNDQPDRGPPPAQAYARPDRGWSRGAPPLDCGSWVWRDHHQAYEWIPAPCGPR